MSDEAKMCGNCTWFQGGAPICENPESKECGEYQSNFHVCSSWKKHIPVVHPKQRVDLVEVVRCKDCQHYDRGICNEFYEMFDNGSNFVSWVRDMVEPDDFCSKGERKQDG